MSETGVDFSASAILQRMRDGLKNPVNKLEGGFCMDNLQAVSEEMARINMMEIQPIPDRVLIDTAEGEYLDRKALDYAETRNPAQVSLGKLLFTGDAGTNIPQGTVAAYDTLLFETTSPALIGEDGSCEVDARCQMEGTAGNAPANTVVTLPSSIPGVKSVTNPLPFGGGAEQESDEAFRSRILDKIRRPLTSGNRNHLIYWAKQVSGVGSAKCLGAEVCGAGKAKVIVLSDTYQAPDNVVLDHVKDHIEEERQIGADITVMAATPKPVTIDVTIRVASGYDISSIRQNALKVLQAYIDSVNKEDFDTPPSRNDQNRESSISYYRIGDLFFSVDGVADIVSYTLNGDISSLSSSYEEYFVLEEVNIGANQRQLHAAEMGTDDGTNGGLAGSGADGTDSGAAGHSGA